MNKKKLTLYVDLALIAQFVLVGYSSFIIYFHREAASPLLILVHDKAEILCIAFIVAHMILNWRWILFTARKYCRRRKEVKEGEVIEANYMPID